MNHHEEREEHEGKEFEALSGQVIGCAIEVHRFLGPGLLESSYQRCLSRELELNGIAHACEAPLPIEYKGISLECGYRVDLLVERATTGYLFDRFVDAWLAEGSLTELRQFLQRRAAADGAGTGDLLLHAIFLAKQGENVDALQAFAAARGEDGKRAFTIGGGKVSGPLRLAMQMKSIFPT